MTRAGTTRQHVFFKRDQCVVGERQLLDQRLIQRFNPAHVSYG